MIRVKRLVRRFTNTLTYDRPIWKRSVKSGQVYVVTPSELSVTKNFGDDPPDWTPVFFPAKNETFYDLTLDSLSPYESGIVWATDGLYWSDDLNRNVPTFRKILER